MLIFSLFHYGYSVNIKWHLTVVLICIFLKTNNFEYLFTCIFNIHVSMEHWLFKSFVHFLIELLVSLSWKHPLYILDFRISYMTCKSFSHSAGCLFTFFMLFFETQKSLIATKHNLSIFSFSNYAFDVISKKSLPHPRSQRINTAYFWELFSFNFYIKSIIYLEFIFVYNIR